MALPTKRPSKSLESALVLLHEVMQVLVGYDSTLQALIDDGANISANRFHGLCQNITDKASQLVVLKNLAGFEQYLRDSENDQTIDLTSEINNILDGMKTVAIEAEKLLTDNQPGGYFQDRKLNAQKQVEIRNWPVADVTALKTATSNLRKLVIER